MKKLLFPAMESGKSLVLDEMNDPHAVPTNKHKRKIRKEMRFLEERPFAESQRNKRVKKLEGTGDESIYELRIKAPSRMAYRLLFAIRSVGYVALRFFLKKSENYQAHTQVAIQRIKQYDEKTYDDP